MTTLVLDDAQADALRRAVERVLKSARKAPSVRRIERDDHAGCDLYCVSCDDRFVQRERDDPGEPLDHMVEVALRDILDALTRPSPRRTAEARETLHRLRNLLQAVTAHATTCNDCCGSMRCIGERIAREASRE